MLKILFQYEISAYSKHNKEESRLIKLSGMHGVFKLREFHSQKAIGFLAVAAAREKATESTKAVCNEYTARDYGNNLIKSTRKALSQYKIYR